MRDSSAGPGRPGRVWLEKLCGPILGSAGLLCGAGADAKSAVALKLWYGLGCGVCGAEEPKLQLRMLRTSSAIPSVNLFARRMTGMSWISAAIFFAKIWPPNCW